MNDRESNAFLLQQLTRQRASMFEAVSSYEHRVAALERQVQELNDEAEAARMRVIERESEAQRARTANEELKAAAEELRGAMEQLLASKSWRMTQPFRRFSGFVRRWLRA